MLFLSEKAVFNGSKAIRGGIPLVFPQVSYHAPRGASTCTDCCIDAAAAAVTNAHRGFYLLPFVLAFRFDFMVWC